MTQKSRNLVTILLILLLAGVSSSVAQPANSSAAAERAWESLIAAKGGRATLHSIKSMAIEGVDRTELFRFPKDGWDFGYGPVVGSPALAVYNGASNTQYFCGSSGLGSVAHESTDEGMAVEQLGYLLETKWYKAAPVNVRRIKEGKRELDIIETRIGTRRVDFAFEPEELLVSKVVFYFKGRVVRVYWFDEYSRVNGIMVPRKRAFDSQDRKSMPASRFEDIKISFNVDYKPDIFTKCDEATTPDAWKRGN